MTAAQTAEDDDAGAEVDLDLSPLVISPTAPYVERNLAEGAWWFAYSIRLLRLIAVKMDDSAKLADIVTREFEFGARDVTSACAEYRRLLDDLHSKFDQVAHVLGVDKGTVG